MTEQIKFQHQEVEIVRVPKLNGLAQIAFEDMLDVVDMATLATLAPEMGLEVHVTDAPGGYTQAYANGFNWCRMTDGSILI